MQGMVLSNLSLISPIWASRYKYIEIFDIFLLIKQLGRSKTRQGRVLRKGYDFLSWEMKKYCGYFINIASPSSRETLGFQPRSWRALLVLARVQRVSPGRGGI